MNIVTFTVYRLPVGSITPIATYLKLDQIEARAKVELHNKQDSCHHFMVADKEFITI